MGTIYDEVAYPSHLFPKTHPLRLAVPSVLFGLDYAPMKTARVMEIGCGEGGNIIPLAVSWPDADFFGFDLAASAIAIGGSTIERLDLSNIRLEARDILEIGAEVGQFDYIIAHGVYSWVPDEVREGVLRIVRERLSPNGVAFISYNARPGSNLRETVRQMLLHHLRDVTDPRDRILGAKAFLELIVANAATEDSGAAVIKAICEVMLKRDPRVVFHDELGPFYNPFYLHEFTADIARHDLEYLGDADGQWWREILFPSSRGKAVRQLVGGDRAAIAQQVDFLQARTFHQSIVTHAGRVTDGKVDYERMRQLWVAAPAVVQGESANLEDASPVLFHLGDAVIELAEPAFKQALAVIGGAYPSAYPIAQLPRDAELEEALLQLYTAGRVELSVGPFGGVKTVSERPRVSPYAQLQLAEGRESLFSADHTMTIFEDKASRDLLMLLDGSRNRDDLIAAMTERGHASLVTPQGLETELANLARLGMFVA